MEHFYILYVHSRCTCVHGVGGSKGGAVVRALTSQKFGPGSNPGVKAICGLSLLLVLSLAPRGLSPCTPVFLSPKKWTLPNSNSIWNARKRLNEFLRTPKCFVGKQISNYNLQDVRWTDLFFRLVLQTKLVRVSFKLTSIIWVIFVSESKLLRAKLPTARIASWQKHNLKALTVD